MPSPSNIPTPTVQLVFPDYPECPDPNTEELAELLRERTGELRAARLALSEASRRIWRLRAALSAMTASVEAATGCLKAGDLVSIVTNEEPKQKSDD